MLPELLLLATATADPAARRLGLVRDAVALWSRATRRRRDWAPHEARCHALVNDAAASLPRRRRLLVLGSGLVRDVPLPALARLFEEVVLLDAVHLLPARLAARRHGARLVTADLTGMAGDPLLAFRDDPTLDLVVSANVLSQLAMAPLWREERRHPADPPDLGAAIVGRHLDDLARFRCPVCLLTDVSYRETDRRGGSGEEEDLLHGHALPTPDEAWDWVVAPPGELRGGSGRVHRVHGYRDLARSRGDSGRASG